MALTNLTGTVGLPMNNQKNNLEYKQPIAALLWSLTIPGFGQFYNKQIGLGIILVIWELTINQFSSLNLAIYHSFQWEYLLAHDVINYQWGLYYPSVWAFSMWQAYNKSLSINKQISGEHNKQIPSLTGFYFGSVIGMNFGIYGHIHFVDVTNWFAFLASPVFSGLLMGITFAFSGHWLEKHFRH